MILENILEVYEALHKRLFPSVKNSLEYLTCYISNLLGSISDEAFKEVAERTAMEYDNDISDEMLLKFRDILEEKMGKLDDVDFAALMNVDVERVFNMSNEICDDVDSNFEVEKVNLGTYFKIEFPYLIIKVNNNKIIYNIYNIVTVNIKEYDKIKNVTEVLITLKNTSVTLSYEGNGNFDEFINCFVLQNNVDWTRVNGV